MTPEAQAELARRMALARKLYCETPKPRRAIAAEVKISVSTLNSWARKEGWEGRGRFQPLETGAGRWVGKTCPGLALCPERKLEIARAWAAASRQVEEIEKRQAALPQAGADKDGAGKADEGAERIAKTFALVVRTMRELAAIEEDKASPRRGPARHGSAKAMAEGETGAADGRDGDQEFPRDIDGLRQDIADRLAGLRRSRTDAAPPGGGAAGRSAPPEA